MNVSDLLRRKGHAVFAADYDATIGQVVYELKRANVGAMVIIKDQQPVGIVSERDIILLLATDNQDALNQPVKSILKDELVTCSSSTSINKVMQAMTQNRTRHIPVIDHGNMVGLISIGDVVKSKIASVEAEADWLKDYISGAIAA